MSWACWIWQIFVSSARFIWLLMLLAVSSTMTRTSHKAVARASRKRTHQTLLVHTTQRQRCGSIACFIDHHFQTWWNLICSLCHPLDCINCMHLFACQVLTCYHLTLLHCSGYGGGPAKGIPQCSRSASQNAHCGRSDLPKELHYQDHKVWQGSQVRTAAAVRLVVRQNCQYNNLLL